MGEAMKYLISDQGWEVRMPGIGRVFYPAGTLIDDSLPQFSHLVGQGPPINALPYDQATYDAMLASPVQGGKGYPYYAVRPWPYGGIVLSGPGSGNDYWANHPTP
jgi:hypothetical protein